MILNVSNSISLDLHHRKQTAANKIRGEAYFKNIKSKDRDGVENGYRRNNSTTLIKRDNAKYKRTILVQNS